MNSMISLDKMKSLATIGSGEAPIISLFIPLRGTYLPTTSIFNSLVRSANLILSREGKEKALITHPDWKTWVQGGARSMAIYYVGGMTTYMPLNIAMEPRVVVASSFHIKPLIASSHLNGAALLLTFHRGGCSLHEVSLADARLHETFIPAKFAKDDRWLEKLTRQDLRAFLDYLKAELRSLKSEEIRFLAIDCPSDGPFRNEDFWRSLGLPVKFLEERGLADLPDRSVGLVQQALEEEFTYSMQGNVYDLLALKKGRSSHSTELVELGDLILNKKITQLFISLEDLHFGEFDYATGKTIVHKGQQNTRDDDLLDDFAELAMRNGIKVRVVPRKFLPQGKSFIVA
jgi:hypothetical protein